MNVKDMFKVYSKDEFGSITSVTYDNDMILPVANNVVVDVNQHSGIRTMWLLSVSKDDVLTVVDMVTFDEVKK